VNGERRRRAHASPPSAVPERMWALTAAAREPWLGAARVAVPRPGCDEALVRVRATSLNRGEIEDLPHLRGGASLGWDVAGVVVQNDADGAAPPAGTRVAGVVRRGAWAELVAVSARDLAAIPDPVEDAVAASLATAGLTALTAVEAAGPLVGRRVLVTGAEGGVGRYAAQLARIAGADVVTLVRGQRIVEDYDAVVDAVGGTVFASAIEHLRPGGIVVNLATSAGGGTVAFRAELFDRAHGARIHTLDLRDELRRRGGASHALAILLDLAASGRLDTHVALELSWQRADAAVDALAGRRVRGKIVLRVDDAAPYAGAATPST
jgi:NADPH:quinone reductase